MPNPILTESDRNPLPFYRLYFRDRYIQFFYDPEKADAYIHMGVLAGHDWQDYRVERVDS
jgi:hypothetical protein